MKSYLFSLLDRLPISADDRQLFYRAGAQVFSADPELLPQAVAIYYDSDFDAEQVTPLLERCAAATGISLHTLRLLLVACSAERIENTYRERGYDPAMFTDFLRDLACKVGECYRWRGEHGLDKISYWYPLFFRLKLFALGRLQYEIYQRPNVQHPITVGGHTVQPEDAVYFIHIPGLGPLTKELCMDSYRRAYTFFKDNFKDKPCVFYCTSWMLYERNREFMSPDSNIVRFMSDFKIVKSFEVPEQKYWWVFDRPYEGDASVLPRDSSLRRRMAEWLENGGKPGGGDGYFLFDGETIIND